MSWSWCIGNITEDKYISHSEGLETYVLPIILFFMLLISLIGNSVLIVIILRHTNKISNAYNLSLALGDLLITMTYVPFTNTVYIIDSWPFGLSICKISEFAKDVSVGISTFTLTALSADRFFTVTSTMQKSHVAGNRRRECFTTIIIIVLIWILAIIFAIPGSFSYIKSFRDNRNVSFCVCYPFPEEFGPDYLKRIIISRFFIYYIIPLIIIAVFYCLTARHLMRSTRNILCEMQKQIKDTIQARKKLARIVIALVIIFAVCFLPQHVIMLRFYFNPTSQMEYNTFWHYFRILAFCLTFANTCIDPIALYYISGTFRKYFRRYLPCLVMMKKRCRRSSEPERNAIPLSIIRPMTR